MAKKELVRLAPFTKPQKHLNSYLNLIKRVKYLYNENDKTLRKEIEDKKKKSSVFVDWMNYYRQNIHTTKRNL